MCMKWLIVIVAWLAGANAALADINQREWTIDGVQRTGLVYTPDATSKRPEAGWPTVFVFHGHMGNGQQVRRGFKIDTLWPDAIVVYLNGLPTVTPLVDKEGRFPGWDMTTPPEKNKDVKLFDAVLKDLINHDHADAKRVFCTGHSNGGGFTYTLWCFRGDTLAGVAPCSAAVTTSTWKLPPKPALISAGRNDPIVRFAWQDKTIDLVKKTDSITGTGKPWGDKDGIWYDSPTHTPLVTLIYDGGHAPPKYIGDRVVEFFKAVSPEVQK